MLPAPSPACGGGSGVGALSKQRRRSDRRKTRHAVSRETLYAVAAEFFRRASRRRYAARIPTAATEGLRLEFTGDAACSLSRLRGWVGVGALSKQRPRSDRRKTSRAVSRETLYAVAAEFFRRASRRRYDARIPSAAGVKPSSRPACPTVRGRAVSSFERASLESPGTSA
jgi:hypothetical protein